MSKNITIQNSNFNASKVEKQGGALNIVNKYQEYSYLLISNNIFLNNKAY